MTNDWKRWIGGGFTAVLLCGLVACGPDAEWMELAESLQTEAAEREARVERLEVQGEELEAEVRRLRAELDRRDTRVSTPSSDRPRKPAPAPEAVPVVADEVGEDAARQDELATLRQLVGGVVRGTAPAEEQQRFWALLRADGAADRLVQAAEASSAERPDDLDRRMALANAYVAKLFTVPPGPEMGVWGGKAEAQWKAVLERDPEHWRARFALAESWSHYPPQLNKTPDSIREFETLAEQQESRGVTAEQAGVYVHLSVLYRRQGRGAEARTVLERGLRRHPGHPKLTKALDALGMEEDR